MTKPTDAELREMVVDAMNGLKDKHGTDDTIMMYKDPEILNEILESWEPEWPDLEILSLLDLGMATCVLMRRDAAMKGESDG